MNRDLGFGPAVYGFGAGVFFLSYALFEVPSSLILARAVGLLAGGSGNFRTGLLVLGFAPLAGMVLVLRLRRQRVLAQRGWPVT